MLGWLVRFFLFLSAYVPLYVVVAITAWPRFGAWSLAPLAVGIVSLVSIPLVRKIVANTQGAPLVVAAVERRDQDVVPYLLGYLLPFIDLDFSDNAKLWAMGVIFLTIGLTQVAANLVHLNPILLMLRWHIFEVTDTDGVSHTVIHRGEYFRRGDKLRVVSLTEDHIHWSKKHD